MMPRTLRSGEQNPGELGPDLLRHVLAAALLAGLAAVVLSDALVLSRAYLVAVGAAVTAGAVLLLGLREAVVRAHPHASFGPANRVTLARAAGALLLAGLALEPPGELRAWSAVAIAGVAAALDAVDGPLARRSGLASRFGARFDMEIDALLILVLATLAWRWDRAGAWVLLSGLLRYGWVAAGAARPWLAGELPPSRRRQGICVAQVVGLVLVLVPWLPPPWAAAVAALSLAALCYSFAVDGLWLARHRSTEGSTA